MKHYTITITLDRYGHLMPGAETEAVDLPDGYLEAQVNRARHLVDVLPARALGPDGRDLDFGLFDGQWWRGWHAVTLHVARTRASYG